MKWILFTFLFSFKTFAFSLTENVCPTKFEAVAEKIEDIEMVDHVLAKVSVHFEEVEVIRGEFKKNEHVELLKHGLFHLEVGKRYAVEMNHGKICLIEEI